MTSRLSSDSDHSSSPLSPARDTHTHTTSPPSTSHPRLLTSTSTTRPTINLLQTKSVMASTSNIHSDNNIEKEKSTPTSARRTSANPKTTFEFGTVATPSRWTLNFEDKELEDRFLHHWYLKRLTLVRFTVPCLLLATLILGLSYDLVYIKKDARWQYQVVRFGIQIPALVLFFGLTFTTYYPRYIQSINIFISLSVGLCNIALSILGSEPDHGPHMLYFFVVYMFLQLRFPHANAVCWILYVCFLVGVRIFVPSYSRIWLALGYMTITNFALIFASYFNEYWTRLDYSRAHMLVAEENRTNELLQTLLPARITIQLKAMDYGDNLIAEEFPSVSILFSDIVGFTSYSASITAREVVNFLNTLYTTFDHLTVVHNVLKVETIGDAYFVASGVTEQRDDHADSLADMAFDMIDILKQFKCKDNFVLNCRIGIHSGRVIAGVVGLKVPRYHLFGESVTIASLMESTGVPGRIQVSEPTYLELTDKMEFCLQPRTDIDTDGKRKGIRTYFLSPTEHHPMAPQYEVNGTATVCHDSEHHHELALHRAHECCETDDLDGRLIATTNASASFPTQGSAGSGSVSHHPSTPNLESQPLPPIMIERDLSLPQHFKDRI